MKKTFPLNSKATHSVPNVIQDDQSEKEPRDTLWSAGICGRRRKNLYSILGKIINNHFESSLATRYLTFVTI